MGVDNLTHIAAIGAHHVDRPTPTTIAAKGNPSAIWAPYRQPITGWVGRQTHLIGAIAIYGINFKIAIFLTNIGNAFTIGVPGWLAITATGSNMAACIGIVASGVDNP